MTTSQSQSSAIAALIAVICLSCSIVPSQNLFADETSGQEQQRLYADKSFSVDFAAEHWNGYTEYEIRAGSTTYGPTGEIVDIRSRLRFPIESILLNFGGTYQSGRLRFAAHAGIQLQNSETVFKDWDTYDGSSGRETFIYGIATNNGKLIGFDVSGSYLFRCGKIEFAPRIEFAFRRMEFDDETLKQVDYAYFDTLTWYLEPYETPQTYFVSGPVLRYKIDYKLLYFGGSAALQFSSGLKGKFTVMVAPVCWANDLDEHLLRFKTAEIASSGRAGYVKLDAGYDCNSFIGVSARIAYHAVKTSGPQDQRFLDMPFGVIRDIPAKTRAEWTTVGAELSLNLTRLSGK
jgi:hypothetical protein